VGGLERSALANDESEESSNGTICLCRVSRQDERRFNDRTRISPGVGPGSGARGLQATDKRMVIIR
jgi:hypothetical protein